MQTNAHKNGIFKYGAGYFLVLLAVLLTPIIAIPVSKIFYWVTLPWDKEFGSLCPFFADLLTCIFWGMEFLFVHLLCCSYQRGGSLWQFAQNKFPKTSKQLSEELAASEAKGEQHFLPFRNSLFLFLIAAFCVALLSAQIDFQVKPFYDFGKKIEPIRMMEVGSGAAVSVVKSVWIVWALKFGYKISEGVIRLIAPLEKSALVWVGTCLFSLLFGVIDVLVTGNGFFWTYLLFYLMFVAVYYFTERNGVKAFWFIFFIYIF